MRIRVVFRYIWLVGLLSTLMIVDMDGQVTWPCDEEGPYPFPEETRYDVVLGEERCIPILIDDFTGVNSFVFFVFFDSRFFEFTGTNTVMSGLPNFTSGDIRYVPEVGPDLLRVSWASASTLPEDLPLGTVLFEACFRAIGPPGSVSDFNITRSSTGVPTFTIQDDDITIPATESIPCTFRDNALIRILAPASAEPQLYLNSSCGSIGGNDSGVAEFSVFNGVRPYTVQSLQGDNFTLAAGDSTFILENLARGDYSYFIIDDAGMSSDTIDFTIGDQIPLTFLANARPPTCANSSNGFIGLTVGGGITFDNNFYRFEWSNGVRGIDEDQIVSLDTGLYMVSVFDSTGCRKDTSFLLEREALEIEIDDIDDAFCAIRENGRLFVRGVGGVPFGGTGYEFQIDGLTRDGQVYSNNITSEDEDAIFLSVPAGRYIVSVVDSLADQNSCDVISSDTIEVNYSRQYTADILSGDASACGVGEARASITINADIPASNFRYIVYNDMDLIVDMGNATSTSFQSTCLPPGDYRLEIEDIQTCGLDTFFSLFACDLQIGIPVEVESCFGQNNGSLSINPSSSNGDISINWSNGDTTAIISGLSPGIYQVEIRDTADCVINETFVLAEAQPWDVSYVIDQPSCPGGLGSIVAFPDGDLEPYVYEWSPDTNFVDTETLSNIPAGTYFVTVQDDDMCEIFDTIVLSDPIQPEFQTSNIAAPFCEGDNSGQAVVTVVPNASYSGQFAFVSSSGASGGGTLSFSITDFVAGDNWVVVSHAISGCVFDTVFVDIPFGEQLEIDIDASSLNSPACFGGAGVVNLIGTGPSGIQFLWPDGVVGNTRVGLPGGTYEITLTAGNCMSIDTLVFFEPDSFAISIDPLNTTFAACEDATTDIVLQSEGGNPGPVEWTWSDANGMLVTQDSFLNDVPVGDYTISATDSRGCMTSLDISVEAGAGILFTLGEIVQPQCFGDLGIITIDTAIGGAGNYRYQVNTSQAAVISEPFSVPPGNYTVRVFDQDGCSSDAMITINLPDDFVADLGADIEIGLGESTEFSVGVTGGGNIATVFWDPVDGVTCLDSICTNVGVSPVQNQTYTVTVIDENGCEAIDDILVTVVRRESVYIPNIFSPNALADAKNRSFRVFPGTGVQSVDFIRVFDRWGNLVHLEEAPIITAAGAGSWDGTFNGRELDPGVFVYVVQVTLLGDTEPTIRSGDFTLVR